jgi:L-threonylcarbamoyladenylate synthase
MISLQQDIEQCLNALRNGGTLLYPTDTVWGLGCDACNPAAVKKVSRLKQRTAAKSYIVLLDSPSKLEEYVKQVPALVYDLIEQAGRPLTIIFPGGQNVAPGVMAPDGSLAIRIVKHPLCTPVIAALGKPLLSTSANMSGGPTPATFSEISQDLLSKVDYVMENHRNDISHPQPSRIIRIDGSGNFEVIRP